MRWTPVLLFPPFLVGVATSLSAQAMFPAAVTRAAMPGPVEPRLVLFHEDDAVGRAPYIGLGVLIGAGSVTAYFVHVARSQKDNDGFFIPPIVFIDVAAGGVVGGLIGWAIHDATHQR
ncbi:MAG: hypothetical protein DMD26_10845 [Gemmatimonadetes bacterium]|nr:MAG: hypothetical protein DMD26_10845 [Gemmatimonadota bacterium]